MENEIPCEVLRAVFPLLDGKDLVFCMLVCRQWHEIAKDDYFWKCICARDGLPFANIRLLTQTTKSFI
jgi:hypothetical protein